MRPLHIFFDMDYTILGMDGSLRPGVQEVFQRLRQDGHTIHIWSGMGVRWGEVRSNGLANLVAGVYEKPLQDYRLAVQRMVERGEIPRFPDLVVDDYPEIVSALGGIVVRPYFWPNPNDREMERVYQIICDLSTNGHSPDQAFRRPAT
ncbi:hypothetical protein HRbin23_00801 [bacterium HR23]|nr:hypothetical protein HRbin23_00801 [bacterium HR23]